MTGKASGERAVRHAGMPEPKKVTLKRQLVAEVEHALAQQPRLRLVKVADGAPTVSTLADCGGSQAPEETVLLVPGDGVGRPA